MHVKYTKTLKHTQLIIIFFLKFFFYFRKFTLNDQVTQRKGHDFKLSDLRLIPGSI